MAVTLVVGYRVVLFNDLMNTMKRMDYVLRDMWVGGEGGYEGGNNVCTPDRKGSSEGFLWVVVERIFSWTA